MRALAFERTNARAGEKAVGALVVFQAVDVREASPDERKQLQEARKAQKIQAKQRRAQRQAEKAGREARRQRQAAPGNGLGTVAWQDGASADHSAPSCLLAKG